jgi:LysR family positive regulator for ilvC
MDLRNLELFVHLAQTLHFGKTAEAMYVTPSTLSRAIQRLEDDTQIQLFERNNRAVNLTHAGQVFLAFAHQTLAAWQQTQVQLQAQQHELTGALSMYCSVTASQSHLPNLLNQYKRLHPNVDMQLVTGDPALAEQRLLKKHSDVAISIYTPAFPEELSFVSLGEVPLVLIAPRAFRIRQMRDVKWHTHQMILPDSGPSKRIVHHWLAEHNIRPQIYAHVGGNEAIVSMVALGVGIGFVPQIVVDHSTLKDQVRMIQVSDIEPYILGLACIRARAEEPKIKALLALA